MSAADLGPEIMVNFRESGVEDHSTILLGAGASMSSGLPSWDEFAIRLLVESDSASEETAKLLLAKQDPLMVVEAARIASKEKWDFNLRKALYEGKTVGLRPSSLHRSAVGHYLEASQKTSLVTLNFDLLLEQVLEDETEIEICSITDGGGCEHEHEVYHLHGVIAPSGTRDVVISFNDYTALIELKSSWQEKFLQRAVQHGALIIAGTSYRDPDLRQWLHKALEGKPEKHKAFVLLAREAFSVSKEKFDEIQQALSDQWAAIGLHPILLQDHSDAAQIIRELRDVHKEGYKSPQQRCEVIWNAHQSNFAQLQQEYSEQLTADAGRLKIEFSAGSIGLTLWLSDGQGQLVRWASHDRIYRDADALRKIPTGHDSAWIAGKAMGIDARLIRALPDSDTGRWRSVLAWPVPVEVEEHQVVSSAVLTIGLPGAVTKYEETILMWENMVAEIVNEWGIRLEQSLF